MNIICLGDSITAGPRFAENQRWTAVLQRRLDSVQADTHYVYNCGVGDDTTAMALDRLEDDIAPLLPGLVLVEFGLNDAVVKNNLKVNRVSQAEFERNLREIRRWVHSQKSKAVFIANHLLNTPDDPQGNGKSYKRNVAVYNKTIARLGQKLNTPVIDIGEMMRIYELDTKKFTAEDGCHLSEDGNYDYAEFIFQGIAPMLGIRLVEADKA